MTTNTGRDANTNGKDLLLATLRHEDVQAVPWVPFSGSHSGKLKGYSAYEVLTDGDKLLEALLEVNKIYVPDGQPVMFDLAIEAEILGCELRWAEDSPPSIASHPLASDMTVPTRLPEKSDGRLPMILNTIQAMKREVGNQTALYGLVAGPLTIASHLRGTELFMDMFDHEDFLHDLIDFSRNVSKRVAEYYIEAGVDVVAVVDPLVSQVSPRHFSQFLDEPFTDIFSHIRAKGAFSAFFVCGDATKNIEVMCKTEPDAISIDENINMGKAKEITDRYNIAIGGNIPLTTTMLMGAQLDNMKYVVDLLDALNHHNLIVSPGCDMPYDIPFENVIGAAEAVRFPDNARRMLVDYHAPEIDIEVDIPDYDHLDKPLIEVFTLDADLCAACDYMLKAAQRAAEELQDKIDLDHYKATTPENVARARKVGVSALPSIVINGKVRFASLIPSHRELLDAVEENMN